LDLISQDFFGGALPRLVNEMDAHFLMRIQINLFRERATRRGVVLVLEELTGQTPIIIEPWNPGDCGAYGVPTSGYGVAGYYGSLSLPYQAFVIAYRPSSSGIPNVAGYGISVGGYGVGQIEYASMNMIEGAVTDADIYAAIASVIAEGTIAWTQLSNAPALGNQESGGYGGEGYGSEGYGT
jgi:hypothetical protein